MTFLEDEAKEKIGFYYVMDKVKVSSVFGQEAFSALKPIILKKELLAEYENIELCLSKKEYFNDFKNIFMNFRDIKNTFKRSKAGNVLDEVELFEVKNFVILISKISALYKTCELNLKGITLRDFNKIYKLLNPMENKSSSFLIYDEYSQRLSQIRASKRNIEKLIYREKDSRRLQLLSDRAKIVNEEKAEELQVRKRLTNEISKYADELIDSTYVLGKLDMILAKAKCALDYGLSSPVLSDKIKIVNGVNPMVKDKVEKKGGSFKPITVQFSKGTTVITGANMGGKTVALSIVALNYLLAYLGFYVFADSFEFVPLDFMCFLSEDAESLQNGLSTFGGEVIKLKRILAELNGKRGFIIFDEFARGTNPEEGSNITKALVKYLGKFDSITAISTHYDGVCSFADVHYQVKGLKNVDLSLINNIEGEEEFIMLINRYMDYSLEKAEKGAAIPKDALNICTLMGLDSEIINTARKFYKEG
ncbi:MutS-related protein [Clostridium neuense]|uniref:MutS-related protein n=1 Tax=Clostridium neuense TaxID=1728934 RepID=A0ABW8TLQ3_9CLOT